MSMLPCNLEVKCGEGKTKQKIGTEHDINRLVARYRKTGQLPLTVDAQGQFIDTTKIGTYQDCMLTMVNAMNTFMAYPIEIRRRFDNDINKFASFLANIKDEKNQKLGVELGLFTERKPVTTVNNDGKGG